MATTTTWGQRATQATVLPPGEAPNSQLPGAPAPAPAPTATSAAPPATPAPATTPLPSATGGFVDTGSGIPSAYDSARQTLTDYGLESLLPWFMAQVQGGATPDELVLNMRQTPEFKAAFPEIGARQKLGKPPVAVSDILSYRKTANELASQAGLPQGFLDPASISQLMIDDVSASELSNRIVNGIGAVNNADPNIRAYFDSTFGTNSPGALAAFFLDPDKAQPILERQVREAEIGGTAKDYGFTGIDPSSVASYAAKGVTQAQADSGFSQMSKISSLFATLPSETGAVAQASGPGSAATVPVGGGAAGVSETTGADALIGKNTNAMDALTQRLDARQAAAGGKVGIEEDQTHGFRGLGASM